MINLTALKVGLGLLAGLAIGWAITDLVNGFELRAQKLKYEKQIMNYVSVCEADKKVTQEVSYDYQEKLATLNDEYTAAQRMFKQRCVNVTTKSTPGANDPKVNSQLSRPDGSAAQIGAEDLLGFAKDAEIVGRKLDSLQDYVRKTQVWFKHMKASCDAHPV